MTNPISVYGTANSTFIQVAARLIAYMPRHPDLHIYTFLFKGLWDRPTGPCTPHYHAAKNEQVVANKAGGGAA